MSKKLSLILGFGVSGFAKIINNASLILCIVLLSKVLGFNTAELGIANYLILITAFISGLGGFGFGEAFGKFARSNTNAILPTIKKNIFLTGCFLVFVLIIDLFFNWLKFGTIWEYILFIGLIFSLLYALLVNIFLGLDQKLRFSIYQIMHTVILLFCLYFFGISKILSVSILLLLSLFISFIVPVVIMLLDLFLQKKFENSLLCIPTNITNFAKNNLVFLILLMIIIQTDSLFLVNLSSDGMYQNGIYKSLGQIGKISTSLGVFASTPLIPIFASLFESKDIPRLKNIYIWSNAILLFILAILVGIVSISHNSIVKTLFNNIEIQNHSFLLPILTAFFGLSGILYITYYFWQMLGRVDIVWKVVMFQVIFYVIGMFFVVQQGLVAMSIFLLILQILAIFFWYIYFYFESKNL